MGDIEKVAGELFNAVIKSTGINFRGIKIGDNLEALISKEGKEFQDRGGTFPNFKYFIELGEMEELMLVYQYHETTKAIQNLEVTLKTYPKYYWEKAGGTDDVEFETQIIYNSIADYIPHFLACKNLIIAHFENQLGVAEMDSKHFVYKHPHQKFSKYTWIQNGNQLTIMSYLNDTKRTQGALEMELKLMLS